MKAYHKMIALALTAAVLSTGLFIEQANARPHDQHGMHEQKGGHGAHGGHVRHNDAMNCGQQQSCVYDALTPEKQAQFDAIMKEFTEKTASLRDNLAAKRLELETLGDASTLDPKAIGKASEELVTLRNAFRKEREQMAERIAKEVGINIMGQSAPCGKGSCGAMNNAHGMCKGCAA